MFENSKIVKKINFNNLKKLKQQDKYERMIEIMDINDEEQIKFVFESIVPIMNAEYLYLFARKTDYRSDFINDLFIKIEYTKINPLVKTKDKSEVVTKTAEEIIKYVKNTKSPDIQGLKRLIKLTGNSHYMYTFWLYNCTNEDLELVNAILKTKSLTYINLLYREFFDLESDYSLNFIRPKIISEEMNTIYGNSKNYNDILEKINDDVNDKINLLMGEYNIKSNPFDLYNEIKLNESNLAESIQKHKNRQISKRDILLLIEEKKLPLIGGVKYICSSQKQVRRVLDKICDDELRQFVMSNASRDDKYLFTDQIIDVIYEKSLRNKEKVKIKRS